MKVKKKNKVLIINDALRDRYLIDLGYEEVIDDEVAAEEEVKEVKAKKNVKYVPTFDNKNIER